MTMPPQVPGPPMGQRPGAQPQPGGPPAGLRPSQPPRQNPTLQPGRPAPRPGPAPRPSGAEASVAPRSPREQAPPPPAIPIPPTAQPDIDPRQPQFRRFELPVSTTDTLPGRTLGQYLGIVIGVVTRPRDLAHNPEMAYLNTAARQDAVAGMVAQASALGAHAVVGLRFDGGKVSDGVSEVTAYGTAVTLA